MTEYNAAVDHRIRVEVSHASRLPALAGFLSRAGCTVDRVGGQSLAVRIDAAPTRRRRRSRSTRICARRKHVRQTACVRVASPQTACAMAKCEAVLPPAISRRGRCWVGTAKERQLEGARRTKPSASAGTALMTPRGSPTPRTTATTTFWTRGGDRCRPAQLFLRNAVGEVASDVHQKRCLCAYSRCDKLARTAATRRKAWRASGAHTF
jgi:hypothetical protein